MKKFFCDEIFHFTFSEPSDPLFSWVGSTVMSASSDNASIYSFGTAIVPWIINTTRGHLIQQQNSPHSHVSKAWHSKVTYFSCLDMMGMQWLTKQINKCYHIEICLTLSAVVTALLGYAVHRAAVMYTPHMVSVPNPKFCYLNTKAVIDNTQTNVWLCSNKTSYGHWNLCLVLFAHAPKYCYSFFFPTT